MASILVTGASGCIGASVVRQLLDRGDRVTALDHSGDRHRLEAVNSPERLAEVEFIHGDVADLDEVRRAVRTNGTDGVIHLAGMQVPSCKADPIRGATVNVLGTLAILEAAADVGCRVVYASSAAVFGPDDEPLRPHVESEAGDPSTHYGIFKLANEGNARIHHLDRGVSSVGLRPLTVYGVGRDFGMTSGPTTALKAALLGRPYEIGFTGPTDFQLVEDVAETFVRCLGAPEGAHVFNVHGETATVEHLVEQIAAVLAEEGLEDRIGLVTCNGPHLPIPGALDDSALAAAIGPPPRTSLHDGIRRSFRAFARLHAEGRLDLRDLPAETTS